MKGPRRYAFQRAKKKSDLRDPFLKRALPVGSLSKVKRVWLGGVLKGAWNHLERSATVFDSLMWA